MLNISNDTSSRNIPDLKLKSKKEKETQLENYNDRVKVTSKSSFHKINLLPKLN